jgi:Myb-like DNA-binding domain
MARRVGRVECHSNAIRRISSETKYLVYDCCRCFQQLRDISLRFMNCNGLPSVGIVGSRTGRWKLEIQYSMWKDGCYMPGQHPVPCCPVRFEIGRKQVQTWTRPFPGCFTQPITQPKMEQHEPLIQLQQQGISSPTQEESQNQNGTQHDNKNRRARSKWTTEETQDLIKGCNIHGVGNWKK